MGTKVRLIFLMLFLTASTMMAQQKIDQLNDSAGLPLLNPKSVWNRADFEIMLLQKRIKFMLGIRCKQFYCCWKRIILLYL